MGQSSSEVRALWPVKSNHFTDASKLINRSQFALATFYLHKQGKSGETLYYAESRHLFLFVASFVLHQRITRGRA